MRAELGITNIELRGVVRQFFRSKDYLADETEVSSSHSPNNRMKCFSNYPFLPILVKLLLFDSRPVVEIFLSSS